MTVNISRYISYFLSVFMFYSVGIQAEQKDNLFHQAFENGIHTQAHYETSNGNTLRYTCFKTPIEDNKKSILFIQGRGTFLEFYEVLIEPLLAKGFDVWMYDLSGQGGSSRLLSPELKDPETVQLMQHIDSFDYYLTDMHDFIENVIKPQTRGPFLLGGYSTGGHLALRYLQQTNDTNLFDGAFIISPLLKFCHIPTSLLYLSSLTLDKANAIFKDKICLFDYFSGQTNEDPIFKSEYEGNGYSSDEKSYNEIKDLCLSFKPFVMGGISLGWLKSAVYSLNSIWKKEAIQAITIPVLIATGGKDTIVDTKYNDQFVNQLPSAKHSIHELGRHELFRETAEIRTKLWSDFDLFIKDLSFLDEEKIVSFLED